MTIITVVISKFDIIERKGELFSDDLVVSRDDRVDVKVMPLLGDEFGGSLIESNSKLADKKSHFNTVAELGELGGNSTTLGKHVF